MTPCPWYITAAAVREYMAIAGYPAQDDGEHFDRAERKLMDAAREARMVHDVGGGNSAGTQQWTAKATIRGKRVRLELAVRPDPREEGALPQLVRVRRK